MATPEQSRPPRTGPEPDGLARSVPEPTHEHLGPEPEENRPGHHPPEEQDQPPLDDFAAKFGIPPESPGDDEPADEPAPPTSVAGRDAEGEARTETADGPGSGAEASESDTDESDTDEPDSARPRDAEPEAVERKGRAPLPRPVRAVWVVTVRRGVLPALGGVRSATVALERVVRRTL